MKRFGRRLKSFTAVLLSACLVFPLGAVNSWAEEPEYSAAAAEETILPDVTAEAAAEAAFEAGPGADAADAAVEAAFEAVQGADAAAVEAVAEAGPGADLEEAFYAEAETASASDAIDAAEAEQGVSAGAENESEAAASSAAEKATASDAQFDEDGFLMDGEVLDDVEATDSDAELEIIAPVMKTEVIGKKNTVEGWLQDYTISANSSTKTVTLKKYIGTETDVYVPATGKIDGVSYNVVIGQAENDTSVWADPNGTSIRSISFEEGVRVPANLSYMFSDCIMLNSVDLDGLNTSNVTKMRGMFNNCWNLTSLDLRGLDTSNVTDMRSMFQSCLRLTDINFGEGYTYEPTKFSTSGVRDMSFMFYNCDDLERLDLSAFEMSNVRDAYRMFYESYNLEYIRTPLHCPIDIELLYDWQTRDGFRMDTLPKGENYSLTIGKIGRYVFVTDINLNTTTRTLRKGETFQLKAWPQPVNATDKEVTWESWELPVATVSSTGLVTAKEEGIGTIACLSADGYVVALCDIIVGVPVTGIKINTTARSLEVGETFPLKAWPQPVNASNREVIWSSSDRNVATVSESGVVTAKTGGVATITAKSQDHGYTATCKITVPIHVTSVKINTTARTIEAGKTFQMAAWPQPANATNKAVTWTSSNPAVAKVSSTGLVTGVKNGTANITVKTVDGGKTATCKITVGIPVTSLVINTTARTILAGKTFQMAAWPQPANASNRAVTWTSTNTTVATVSSTGLVKGIKDGTAVIIVKTVDGGYTKTCNIIVGIPVTGIVINTKAKTMNVGKTFKLAAWPQPTNASNKAVTWTSSNTAVATVSATGLVTAKKAGTATITVKTVDGGYTETCVITVQ